MYHAYYGTLGLQPGASIEDVRRAYRRRAKELHPDLNPDRGSSQDFQQLREAYEQITSSLGEKLETPRPGEPPATAHPARFSRFHCSSCRRPVVQPRARTFWTVRSFLLFSRRKAVHGLFCARCSRAAALKASLGSGLFGWWSITGLVCTPVAIIKNAIGGDRVPGEDHLLLWRSALICRSRGELELALALARAVAASSSSVAPSARSLVATIRQEAPAQGTRHLANPWLSLRLDWWKHALLLVAAPAMMTGVVAQQQAEIGRTFWEVSRAAQQLVDNRYPGARREAERWLREHLRW
jgi:hypothetical protein